MSIWREEKFKYRNANNGTESKVLDTKEIKTKNGGEPQKLPSIQWEKVF